MFEKKHWEEKARKNEDAKKKRDKEERMKRRTNLRNARQGRQDIPNRSPPFMEGFQPGRPQGSQAPASSVLEEVRIEVLRVLGEVLPVASDDLAQDQVLGRNHAYGLAWPPLQRR